MPISCVAPCLVHRCSTQEVNLLDTTYAQLQISYCQHEPNRTQNPVDPRYLRRTKGRPCSLSRHRVTDHGFLYWLLQGPPHYHKCCEKTSYRLIPWMIHTRTFSTGFLEKQPVKSPQPKYSAESMVSVTDWLMSEIICKIIRCRTLNQAKSLLVKATASGCVNLLNSN